MNPRSELEILHASSVLTGQVLDPTRMVIDNE
jgi:hypothetical protein